MTVNAKFNAECIAVHNKLRDLHGCPHLAFDVELAEEAQKHAEHLAERRKMVHSTALDYGENIAQKYGTPGFTFSGAEACSMWYSEILDYDFNGGDQIKCGHFTQMVWNETKQAGFGYAVTREGDVAVIVGQYRPPGNFSGEFIEMVPRPTDGKVILPLVEDLTRAF